MLMFVFEKNLHLLGNRFMENHVNYLGKEKACVLHWL